MYSILIASAVAVLVLVSGLSLEWWGYGWGIPLALIAFLATWIVIGFRLRPRLATGMTQVRKLAEKGMTRQAIEACEAMLPLGKWLPMLTGQLYAQMGALAYASGDQTRARDYFGRASRRAADAQLVHATMVYRDGDKEKAFQILQLACVANKKHAFLHNVRAWLLHKEGRTQDAKACLAKFLQRDKDNEAAKDNLLRLQNDRKMNMQRFAEAWWMLGFEKPPRQLGQVQTGRKGFRQPPKRRKS